MDFQPRRALITRDDDGDRMHESLHDVPAMIAVEPRVGASLQVFLDTGRIMRTSPVRHVTRRGSEWVVDTANSRYRLKLSDAA